MAKRGVAEIVSERQGFGEILVQPERPADRSRNLRDFEAVRQPRAVVVAFMVNEDLGLMGQAAECGRMNDAVTVALKGGADRVLGLAVEPPAALPRL